MMNVKRIIKDKKGVSPLFISLYLALLTVLLISTLFIALGISRSALTERLRIEQERMQESILLTGPNALKLIGGSIVQSLRVNNTGSITVRIRALYIDHKFICDPSEFENDSYIEPKESLWIQLYPNVHPPIILNDTTLNAYWTVTTERGTKSSETGINLWIGPPWIPYSPKKFYFGPLMLVFDMFHWRSGTGPWINGWTIPKGTKDVTWRILLVNVDNRNIHINDTSCFTLISNDNAPKDPLPWYIDPTLSNMTFIPSKFYFVYYAWSKPFSEGGASKQGVTGITDLITCINFLTFHGSFEEPNGTRTPFGQTIPFEAVLVTTESMASSLQLVANPENIPNDGVSTSTITATVLAGKTPVPNAWVDFYTTAGTLSATHATTNANGEATVTLTSTTAKTTAYIAALCQGVEGTAKVSFTPAHKIKISPTSISVRRGATALITVQLVDGNNLNVTQSGITITVTLSNTKIGQLEYDAQLPGQTQTVTTNANGQATLTFKASTKNTGTGTITASASGLTSDPPNVTVTVIP